MFWVIKWSCFYEVTVLPPRADGSRLEQETKTQERPKRPKAAFFVVKQKFGQKWRLIFELRSRGQLIKLTVDWTDSWSNRQLIEQTVDQTDSWSNRQLIEQTVEQKDNWSKGQMIQQTTDQTDSWSKRLLIKKTTGQKDNWSKGQLIPQTTDWTNSWSNRRLIELRTALTDILSNCMFDRLSVGSAVSLITCMFEQSSSFEKEYAQNTKNQELATQRVGKELWAN